MACQSGCSCCRGACCYDFAGEPTCTSETCADCESFNGEFQGIGTECSGEDSSDCPCDPPAEHSECQKCVDGTPVSRCSDTQHCCDGTCQEEECPPVCDPPCNAGFPDCEACVDGVCVPAAACAENEACCVNQNSVGGCWPFPGRCPPNEDWCSNCGDGGGIETRIGPYETSFEAGVAATEACSGCDGLCSTSTEQCGDDWYGYVCCTPEVP